MEQLAPERINVFDEVEAYLQSETRRPQDRHYASSIVQCPRRAWFGLKNVPKTHTISLSGYLKMKLGDAIGVMWTDLLDETANERYENSSSILDRLEAQCPIMRKDIEEAVSRDERPYNVSKYITHNTAAEVPSRIKIPGCDMEVGMRVDNVYTSHNNLIMGETKSSHSTRTMMLLKGYIPISYLIQAGLYKYRYSELPTEIHYIDRQSCYPYRFGFDYSDNDMIVQPGGYGRRGTKVSGWLNGYPLIEYVAQRLMWIESLLDSNDPPGRFVAERVSAPRDPHKEFFVCSIKGFEKNPLMLESDEYHMLLYGDGKLINKKKQANKVSYSSGFCPYCSWRGICADEVGKVLVEEEDKPAPWEQNYR